MNINLINKLEYLNNNSSNRLSYKSKLMNLVKLSMKNIHRRTLKKYISEIWKYMISTIDFLLVQKMTNETFQNWLNINNNNVTNKFLIVDIYSDIMKTQLTMYHHYLQELNTMEKAIQILKSKRGLYTNYKIILMDLNRKKNILNKKLIDVEFKSINAWKSAKQIKKNIS